MENMFMYEGRQVFWHIGSAGSIEVRVPSVFFVPPDIYEELIDMAEDDQIWANQCRNVWNKIVKTHMMH